MDDCLFMHRDVEARFDSGYFVLIPAQPSESPIKSWKMRITNDAVQKLESAEVSHEKENVTYLRYGRDLIRFFEVRQVSSTTSLPSFVAGDGKPQAMFVADDTCKFKLSQIMPFDFELETAVVVTDSFVVESLRISRYIRINSRSLYT